jgi:hypothetical protein
LPHAALTASSPLRLASSTPKRLSILNGISFVRVTPTLVSKTMRLKLFSDASVEMEAARLAIRDTASESMACGVLPLDQRVVGKAVVPTEMTMALASSICGTTTKSQNKVNLAVCQQIWKHISESTQK